MNRFTFDSATEFLLGHCVHSLSAALPYPHDVVPPVEFQSSQWNDFAAVVTRAYLQLAKRARSGWLWPLFEIFKDKTADDMKVVHTYLHPIIQAAIQKKQEPSDVNVIDDDDTLLDHLVKFTSGEEKSSHGKN